MAITPMISLENATFQYQNQTEPTLKNINLALQADEKALITGPSGSGKSTLGNLLNGVLPEEFPGELSGKIMIDGKNLAELDLTALSFEVGTVLQTRGASS